MKTFYTCLVYITLAVCNISFCMIQASMLVHIPQEIKQEILGKIIDEYQSLKNDKKAEKLYRQLISISRVNKELYNLLFGKKNSLEKKLKAAIQVRAQNFKAKHSKNSLHRAIQENYVALTRELLEICKINKSNSGYFGTPLIHAIGMYQTEIIKVLLSHPNTNVNKRNKNIYISDTPLTYAISHENLEAVKLLLNHPKIDIIKTNSEEKTPLELANKIRISEEIIDLLIKKGA